MHLLREGTCLLQLTGERRGERAKETVVGEGQVERRVLELGGRWVESESTRRRTGGYLRAG